MKIISVVGARPNFMKIAPIISEINKYNEKERENHGKNSKCILIQHVLVHTGQHYDNRMSDIFFSEFNLPEPDIFLGVGSGSHAKQTAEIMKKFEDVLAQENPNVVIVVGDVNSTLACSLVVSKISNDSLSRPMLVHVESGLRSFDRFMPEEINRVLTDHVSDLLFVTEESGIRNLENEGIPASKICLVGNTMIDTLHNFKDRADGSQILHKLGLAGTPPGAMPYSLLTLHRPSNVDSPETFKVIISALMKFSFDFPIIFPVHPKTEIKIKQFDMGSLFEFRNMNRREKASFNGKIILIPPLGYIDFLCLMKNAKMVLTDSGGVQEETTCLGVPCVTIRDNTERPVTVTDGTNVIAGTKEKGIIDAMTLQLEREVTNSLPKYWDGKAASRIVHYIVRKQKAKLPSTIRNEEDKYFTCN